MNHRRLITMSLASLALATAAAPARADFFIDSCPADATIQMSLASSEWVTVGPPASQSSSCPWSVVDVIGTQGRRPKFDAFGLSGITDRETCEGRRVEAVIGRHTSGNHYEIIGSFTKWGVIGELGNLWFCWMATTEGTSPVREQPAQSNKYRVLVKTYGHWEHVWVPSEVNAADETIP